MWKIGNTPECPRTETETECVARLTVSIQCERIKHDFIIIFDATSSVTAKQSEF